MTRFLRTLVLLLALFQPAFSSLLAGVSAAAEDASIFGSYRAIHLQPLENGQERIRLDWKCTGQGSSRIEYIGVNYRFNDTILAGFGSSYWYQVPPRHARGSVTYQDARNSSFTIKESAVVVTYDWNSSYRELARQDSTATHTFGDTALKDRGYLGEPRYLDPKSESFVSDPVSVTTGEFYDHHIDLVVAAPLPIEISRSYSSRNTALGDLGYNWLTGYHTSLVVSPDQSEIEAADPTGSVLIFRRESTTDTWRLSTADNPEAHSANGANPLAHWIERITNGPEVLYLWHLPDGTRRDFTVRSFPITDAGPTLQRTRPYLTAWLDAHGNELRLSYGTTPGATDYGLLARIDSSSGPWVKFTYLANLLRTVEANDGRTVTYGYDSVRSNLTSVTQPGGLTYTFVYSPEGNRRITRVTRSDGRVLENDYDSAGRVTIQRATVDPSRPNVLVQNAAFDYSQPGKTIVTDAYGRKTVYEHTNGLITAIREFSTAPTANNANALRTTTRQWFSATDTSPGAYPRALKQTTDPRGLVTDYKYDSDGNITETKLTGDLDGDPATPPTETHVVTAHYNALNLPEWTADSATGLTTDFFYEDPDYPRLATRVVVKHTATGTILRTDKFDHTERSGTLPALPPATEPTPIFARGLLAKRTLALGTPDEAVTDYDYDATGFRTSEIRRTGTTDPDVSLAFTPTARREIHTLSDAAGHVTTFTYDDASRPRTQTVKTADGTTLATTETAYNAHGEVTRRDGPRPGSEDWAETTYDQAGRPAETRTTRAQAKADGSGIETPPAPADKAVSRLYHDLFGNLALTTDPKGHATTHRYDALGRLTHTRRFDAAHAPALLAQYQADQLARRTYDGSLPAGVPATAVLSLESFTYEPGGQVTTHTDVLGGTTTTLYNSRGQPRHRTAPDGSVTEWRYLPDGRLARQILRNRTYWQTDYDDLARTVTRTLKLPNGTPLATELRTHDRRGNLVSLTDAEGSVSQTTYDDLDRVKTTTGPAASPSSAASSLTYTYDAAGLLTVLTNGLGEKTLLTRDALGRTTREEIRDALGATVRLTTFAHAADHRSVTATQGTGAGALVTTTYADPQGRPLLTRFADGTYSAQTYDLAGLPATSRDPLGRLTSTTFEALGHLATRTEPDSHLTTFVHNPAGQLLERRMASPQGTLIARTTYDNAGRPTSRRLLNGAAETRLTSYTYHPATHASWAGLPDTTTDPRGIVSTFAYDDFLRPQTLTTDGPLAETDSTTTYAYDRRGLLTQIVQNAPANGPPTLVSRPRDAYGRVHTETITVGGATLAQFEQRWDSAGRRTRLLPSVPSLPSSSTLNFNFGHRADGAMSAVTTDDFSASFAYADHGLSTSRQNRWRVQTITQRDALGRIQSSTDRLADHTAPLQTETQTWRADGTLDTYSATRSAPGAWPETRTYGYDERSRVETEGFSPAPGQSATLTSTFDHGAIGLGIRTDLKLDAGAPSAWQSVVPTAADVNAFARVTGDASNAAGKAVPSAGISLGADYVELRVNGSARGRAAHPGWADATGAWSALLTLDAGPQTLEARATHPSGRSTATATSDFTVSVPLVAVTSVYDAEGNVTSRTFPGRVQTLTWDAFNRLVHVAERDADQNGYDWSALYDGLGRRLSTTHQPILAGAASGPATTLVSLYDPQHEFLEIAVLVDGAPAWKVHGPDVDGRYGGWNGTGGLEAVLTPDLESAAGGFRVKTVVCDAFGHLVATVSGHGAQQRAEWLATRVGGYGPLPNHRAEILTSPLRLAESSAWRTRRLDPTGFYWLGARYYETHSGRFLSPDPYGHSSDMSLYAFANGDPVNRFDPDGRTPMPETLNRLSAWEASQRSLGFVSYGGPELRASDGRVAAVPLTVTNVAAVIADAVGKTAVGLSTLGAAQVEPGAHRTEIIGSGYSGLRTSLGDRLGIPVNNPRFNLASDLTAAAGGYAAARAMVPRTVSVETPLRALTAEEAALYERPTSFRLGVRDQIWEQSPRNLDGTVLDSSGMKFKPGDPWEAGHLPEYQLEKWQRIAADEGWTRRQWLDFQNDPGIYRAELPWSNMSHAFEYGDWQGAFMFEVKPNTVPIWPAVGFGAKCRIK